MKQKPDLQIGDEVLVNPAAFDEQIERLQDPSHVHIVHEVKETKTLGASGQWVKLKYGIRLVDNESGLVNIDDGWIDKAWLEKVKN